MLRVKMTIKTQIKLKDNNKIKIIKKLSLIDLNLISLNIKMKIKKFN